MEILRLYPADAERFRAIRLRSLEDAPQMFGSSYEETAARPPESWPQQLEQLTTFIAVSEDLDIGVVRGGEYDRARRIAIFYSMWVAPAFRGRGVGEALIDTVADWSRAHSFAYLVLDVAHHNAHAIALYGRKGFVRVDDEGTLDPAKERRLALRL